MPHIGRQFEGDRTAYRQALSKQVQAETAAKALPDPLLGPPGPYKGQGEETAPFPLTRRKYEDADEYQRQSKHYKKYGTITPGFNRD